MPAALGAVAGLDAVVIAIMALLLLYGTLLFVQACGGAIAAAVENVPVVGGDIADAIRGAANWMAQQLNNLYSYLWQNASNAALQVFDVSANGLRTSAFWSAYTMAQIGSAVIYLAHTVAGNAFGALESWVEQVYGTVTSWTYQLVTTVQNNIVAWVQQSYQQLASWAEQQITTAEQYTTGLAQTLVQDVQYLENELAQQIQATDGYIQQTYTQATTYAQQIVTQAENDLSSEFTQGYNQLAQSIVQTQQWAEQEFSQTTDYINGISTAITNTITTSILPDIAAIDQTITECLTPMCDNGPDFFKGFKLIEDLLTGFSLLELLSAAVHNPEQTASDIAGEVDGLVSDPLATITSWLGV